MAINVSLDRDPTNGQAVITVTLDGEAIGDLGAQGSVVAGVHDSASSVASTVVVGRRASSCLAAWALVP